MLKAVGKEGAVIAFEPQWKIYRELVNNLQLNNFTENVIPCVCAVGDHIGMTEMGKSIPTNEGGTGIGSGGNPVQMITLDSLGLMNVSFMKIDVEGSEYKVLIGAEETIRTNNPVMIIEILGGTYVDQHTQEQKEFLNQIISLLNSYGYYVSRISPHDYLAVPKGNSRNSWRGGFYSKKRGMK